MKQNLDLQTSTYRQEYSRFLHAYRQGALDVEQANTALEPVKTLFEKHLVSRVEFERYQSSVERAKAAHDLLDAESRSNWQGMLANLQDDLDQELLRQGQLEDHLTRYTVLAPITGTIENAAALSPGSYVSEGSVLAVISPLSDLVAELFVSPADIGILRIGMTANVQLDAFNYTDWGFVTGQVSEIADDFTLVNNQPVFRVRVRLDRTRLTLKIGFSGTLKKGMTLRAHLVTTNRSLFQLLRDNVNQWLNPSQATIPT